MRIRSLLLALAVVLLPALASAQQQQRQVLRPGELSVGAEILPAGIVAEGMAIGAGDPPPPSAGFNFRYSFDERLALIGTLGMHLVTVADDRDDPPVRYSVGVGGQFNLLQSRTTALLFRGGLQFMPRRDATDQELGVRFWAGPGFEARVAEALSIQFYSPLLDLQVGGDTRFDIEFIPSTALFLYF